MLPMVALNAVHRLFRRFIGARGGVSAVEFALILPIMLLLYAGTVEITQAVLTDRKVNRLAGTVADLVTQNQSVTSSAVTNIFNASTAIMEPRQTTGLRILLLAVDVTATAQTVAWSQAQNDATVTPGTPTPIPVPTSIAQVGTQTIVVRVRYTYVSPFSSLMSSITGSTSYNLEHVFMMNPRAGTSISYT